VYFARAPRGRDAWGALIDIKRYKKLGYGGGGRGGRAQEMIRREGEVSHNPTLCLRVVRNSLLCPAAMPPSLGEGERRLPRVAVELHMAACPLSFEYA
jgi:hypothetical protein